MHSKASQAVNVLGMLGSLFLGPVGAVGVIFFGFRGQKMAMQNQAEEIAEQLSESDDAILDAVDEARPDVSFVSVRHTFPLRNDAVFSIFNAGESEVVLDRTTGKKFVIASAHLGFPPEPEDKGEDET